MVASYSIMEDRGRVIRVSEVEFVPLIDMSMVEMTMAFVKLRVQREVRDPQYLIFICKLIYKGIALPHEELSSNIPVKETKLFFEEYYEEMEDWDEDEEKEEDTSWAFF